jgi:hypothetical protein
MKCSRYAQQAIKTNWPRCLPKGRSSVQGVREAAGYKEELEEVIAHKFVEALRVRFDRELGVLKRGDAWPDFLTYEVAQKVGIEVVEVVNPDHVAKGLAYRENLSVEITRARRLLIETIEAKIARKYPTPRTWSLWLLAYDVTSALAGQHELAAREAHVYLQSEKHPFSEIWLIWPTTGEIPSFLESVWPNTTFTSTARAQHR